MNIYKVTNLVNGKTYIGQELNYNPLYFGSGLLIRRAIKKYGVSNFKKEILELCSSKDCLNKHEIYWIAQCNSMVPNGYNICKGGNGGDTFTENPRREEIRKGMSIRYAGDGNPMYGRRHTQKTIKQISTNKKGQRKGIPTWNKGKKMPEEYCKQRSIQYTGAHNPTAKTFHVISPNQESYMVVGNLDNFCRDHKLFPTTMRSFINKGIIPASSRKCSTERINLTGWEIREVLRDHP